MQSEPGSQEFKASSNSYPYSKPPCLSLRHITAACPVRYPRRSVLCAGIIPCHIRKPSSSSPCRLCVIITCRSDMQHSRQRHACPLAVVDCLLVSFSTPRHTHFSLHRFCRNHSRCEPDPYKGYGQQLSHTLFTFCTNVCFKLQQRVRYIPRRLLSLHDSFPSVFSSCRQAGRQASAQ